MEEEKKSLSQEEIKERKENLKKFYLENIMYLKVQKEYEELLKDIEVIKAERIQTQIALAQYYANSQKAEEEFNMSKENMEESSEMESDLPQPKRTLKREL
jgi:hypothetical protein